MPLKPFLCGLLLLLTACGGGAPSYQTTTYTLPKTPGGRLCATQCAEARDYCRESCALDVRACYNDMQSKAQQDYDLYTRAHFADRKSIKLLPSDFEHPEACVAEKKTCIGTCIKPYNACYTSCGGVVTTTSYCQFLCFE